MKHVLAKTVAPAIGAALLLAPTLGSAGGFEKRTSRGEYPDSIIDRPIALPKDVFLIDVSYRFRYARDSFNNVGCANMDATHRDGIPTGCFDLAAFDGEGPDGRMHRKLERACPELGPDDAIDDANGDGVPDDGIPDCLRSSRVPVFSPVGGPAIGYPRIHSHIWDIDLKYGITSNWTFWLKVPLVYFAESYDVSSGYEAPKGVDSTAAELLAARACRPEGVDDPDTECNELPVAGKLPLRRTFNVGDTELGMLYQLINTKKGPKRALAASLMFRLPSGNESTATTDLVEGVDDPTTPEIEFRRRKSLITGSGTIDAELKLIYKHTFLPSLAGVLELGYLGRIEGRTQYIHLFSRSEIFGLTASDWAGKVDFGDELFARGHVLIAPTKRFWIDAGFSFLYRFPTRVAQGTIVDSTIMIDEKTMENTSVFSGAHYRDIEASRGWLVSFTPTFTYRIGDHVDISLFGTLHLAGRNGLILTNHSMRNAPPSGVPAGDRSLASYDGTEVHAYLPLQAQGLALGSRLILGDVGVRATFNF